MKVVRQLIAISMLVFICYYYLRYQLPFYINQEHRHLLQM